MLDTVPITYGARNVLGLLQGRGSTNHMIGSILRNPTFQVNQAPEQFLLFVCRNEGKLCPGSKVFCSFSHVCFLLGNAENGFDIKFLGIIGIH